MKEPVEVTVSALKGRDLSDHICAGGRKRKGKLFDKLIQETNQYAFEITEINLEAYNLCSEKIKQRIDRSLISGLNDILMEEDEENESDELGNDEYEQNNNLNGKIYINTQFQTENLEYKALVNICNSVHALVEISK